MYLTACLLGIVVVLLLKWVWDRKQRQTVLGQLGIPHPKPSLMMGSYDVVVKKGLRVALQDWTKQYGKTFGWYEGDIPIIAIGDTEMAKEILIKQFHIFHEGKGLMNVNDQGKYKNVFESDGDDWKRLRTTINPVFTARRMKEMSPLVNSVVDILMERLEAAENRETGFNIYSYYQSLTFQAIAVAAFGFDLDEVQREEPEFLTHCREGFEVSENKTPILLLFLKLIVMFGPKMKAFLSKISSTKVRKTRGWFIGKAQTIIDRRKEHGSTRTDILDMLLNAEEGDMGTGGLADSVTQLLSINMESDAQELQEKTSKNEENPVKRKKKKKGLTTEEVEAQVMMFLAAGYETTSSAIAKITHDLAVHQDLQRKVQEEIDEHFPGDKIPDYETLQKLEYFDMFIKESFRVNITGDILQFKWCLQDTKVKDMFIPKGTCVFINKHWLHWDPELWGPEDIKEFVPERHTPERRANRPVVAMLPFGAGPRNCLGMRFAYMEMKFALVRILKRWNIETCDRTEHPLPIKKNFSYAPLKGVWVKLVERQR